MEPYFCAAVVTSSSPPRQRVLTSLFAATQHRQSCGTTNAVAFQHDLEIRALGTLLGQSAMLPVPPHEIL